MMKILSFMNYKIYSLFFVFLIIQQWANAQMFEDNWQTERSFKATRTFIVSVNNKYGSVVVSTWDKDSVKISVSRHISEKSPERLKRMIESINIKFREGDGQLWAETVLGSKHTSFLQDVKEAGNYSSSTPNTRVDYKIIVPTYVHLDITNKYGDVVLPSLSGHVRISLSNGNIQGDNLSGLAELNSAFGDVEIKNIRQGTVMLNFVNFSCDKADLLNIEGRSSQIKIKDVNRLKISSRRDRIFVNNVKNIEADTYFSNINCESVKEFATLKLTYGTLEQLSMANTFLGCNIVSQTCDVNLRLVSPVAYSALIKSNKSLTVPPELRCLDADYKKTIASQPVRFVYKKEMSFDKLKINISDGDLKIDHR